MRAEAKPGVFAAFGALFGGIAGNVATRAFGDDSTGIAIGTVFGATTGALMGGVAGGRAMAQETTQIQIGPAQDIQPLAQTGNGSILTVDPSVTSQTIALNPSTPVLIYIPAGFHWVSVDGSPIADTTSPYEFTFLGAVTHTFVWVDSRNQQHTTVYNFVLLPQTQSTTA